MYVLQLYEKTMFNSACVDVRRCRMLIRECLKYLPAAVYFLIGKKKKLVTIISGRRNTEKFLFWLLLGISSFMFSAYVRNVCPSALYLSCEDAANEQGLCVCKTFSSERLLVRIISVQLRTFHLRRLAPVFSCCFSTSFPLSVSSLTSQESLDGQIFVHATKHSTVRRCQFN